MFLTALSIGLVSEQNLGFGPFALLFCFAPPCPARPQQPHHKHLSRPSPSSPSRRPKHVAFGENGNSCRECVPYQIRSMVDYSQHEITYGQYLNLNGCQKISDEGIEAITNVCPTLKVFSIYWNVRITDMGIKHLVKNCKYVTKLNLSGYKNISDKSLQLVAENYPKLELLNLTRPSKSILISRSSKSASSSIPSQSKTKWKIATNHSWTQKSVLSLFLAWEN